VEIVGKNDIVEEDGEFEAYLDTLMQQRHTKKTHSKPKRRRSALKFSTVDDARSAATFAALQAPHSGGNIFKSKDSFASLETVNRSINYKQVIADI